jgi:hypothetical protein
MSAVGSREAAEWSDAEAYVGGLTYQDLVAIRPAPVRRTRDAAALTPAERKALLSNINLTQWQPTFKRVPDSGASYFRFPDPIANWTRICVEKNGFVNLRSILLITTSLGAHFCIGGLHDGVYVKLKNGRLVDTGFPVYEYTELCPPGCRVIHVAISGVCILYGNNVMTPDQLVRFIREQALDIEDGFVFDKVCIQIGTNDVAQGLLKTYVRPADFPRTEELFQDRINEAATSVGLAFSKSVSLLGFGSPSKRSGGPRFQQVFIGAGYDYPQIHDAMHRMYLRDLMLSYLELEALHRGEPVPVDHSPLSLFPPMAMQKDALDKVGHCQARFYGDLAVDFSNAIMYGLMKADADYSPSFYLCPGIPPTFSVDPGMVHRGVAPEEEHYHGSDDSACPGVMKVLPRSQNVLGVLWADFSGFRRVLFGETCTTAMYLPA